MNVTNKTTKLFSILDITEQQAQDLLFIATNQETLNTLSGSEEETLNNLRQAFLAAGLTKKDDENAS